MTVRSSARLAAVLLALLVGATGCGAPRAGQQGAVDPCASAIPRASDVVRDHGRLVFVRRASPRDLQALFGPSAAPTPGRSSPLSPTPTRSPRPPLTQRLRSALHPPAACLVIYRGHFRAGDVEGAPGQAGRYAVVVVHLRPLSVDRVRVLDTLPRTIHAR